MRSGSKLQGRKISKVAQEESTSIESVLLIDVVCRTRLMSSKCLARAYHTELHRLRLMYRARATGSICRIRVNNGSGGHQA
jgi:hypothetical protein